MKRIKKYITLLLLLVVLTTQQGCLALAAGFLIGTVIGNTSNTRNNAKAIENRRLYEEKQLQKTHVYMVTCEACDKTATVKRENISIWVCPHCEYQNGEE